jgi:hypothetical protein
MNTLAQARATARDTVPCLSRDEEHEEGIASDDWLEAVEWQARIIAAELMILRAKVDSTGEAAEEEWSAVEEPLRELWRSIDLARGERQERKQPESGTHRRARRDGAR